MRLSTLDVCTPMICPAMMALHALHAVILASGGLLLFRLFYGFTDGPIWLLSSLPGGLW